MLITILLTTDIFSFFAEAADYRYIFTSILLLLIIIILDERGHVSHASCLRHLALLYISGQKCLLISVCWYIRTLWLHAICICLLLRIWEYLRIKFGLHGHMMYIYVQYSTWHYLKNVAMPPTASGTCMETSSFALYSKLVI